MSIRSDQLLTDRQITNDQERFFELDESYTQQTTVIREHQMLPYDQVNESPPHSSAEDTVRPSARSKRTADEAFSEGHLNEPRVHGQR